ARGDRAERAQGAPPGGPVIEPLLLLGAACLLTSSDTRLHLEGDTIVEEVRLEVLADGPCAAIDALLPVGTAFVPRRPTFRPGDGGRRRLEIERWERSPRGDDGEGSARLHVPEMRSGDRVALRFERRWDADAGYLWRPGAD